MKVHKSDIRRNACQLYGRQADLGYDWWWHSFTGVHEQTGKEKAFFIEFFVCNKNLGKETPVFGQLEENKKNKVKPSYVMVKAGAWGKEKCQLHRFFGWNEESVNVDFGVPFSVTAKDCFVTETETHGTISISKEERDRHPEWMCDAGEMSWDLKIQKQISYNVGYGASTLFRKMQAFEMYWHAEGMKTFYEGTVTLNGESYKIKPETCYGYADKNWGKGFTSPWVWLSSCNITSELTGKKLENTVFDIGGGKPKIGPLVLNRKLLSGMYYEGTGYEFNFSKFWTFCKTKFHAYETDTEVIWHVEQKTLRNQMITDIHCKKEEMLLVNYEAPNGEKRHKRLFNGGTGEGVVSLFHDKKLVDRMIVKNVGCEYGEYDTEERYQ